MPSCDFTDEAQPFRRATVTAVPNTVNHRSHGPSWLSKDAATPCGAGAGPCSSVRRIRRGSCPEHSKRHSKYISDKFFRAVRMEARSQRVLQCRTRTADGLEEAETSRRDVGLTTLFLQDAGALLACLVRGETPQFTFSLTSAHASLPPYPSLILTSIFVLQFQHPPRLNQAPAVHPVPLAQTATHVTLGAHIHPRGRQPTHKCVTSSPLYQLSWTRCWRRQQRIAGGRDNRAGDRR
jgi:hypothetical protein